MFERTVMTKSLDEQYFEFLDELRIKGVNMHSADEVLRLQFQLPKVIAAEILSEWFSKKDERKQLLNE